MSLSNCHRSGFIVISFVSSTSLLSLNCQIQFQLRFDVERQRVPTGLLKLGCHVAIGACISTLCCVYECIHYLGSIHGLVANVITVTTQHNASVNSMYPMDYAKGSLIIKEGDVGSIVYVMEGRILFEIIFWII